MNGRLHICLLFNVLAANGQWLIKEFQKRGHGHEEVEFLGVVKIYKELGPRTANMALSISLKMKMIEKVLKSDYSANEFLLILCLWL